MTPVSHFKGPTCTLYYSPVCRARLRKTITVFVIHDAWDDNMIQVIMQVDTKTSILLIQHILSVDFILSL